MEKENTMNHSTRKNNDIDKVSDDDETITSEDLRLHFPALSETSRFDYSGKCSYCNVEINFSDTTHLKIKINDKGKKQKFFLYHKGAMKDT